MQPTEQWAPVVGHIGYEVSDHGRVRSYRKAGKTPGLDTDPHLLKVGRTKLGYGQVTLAEPRRKRYVHDLVATAFLGSRPTGADVAHWDNDGMNNCVSNLRWATAVENMADKLRHGTHNRGERSGTHKLSVEQVAEIRARYGPHARYRRGLETQRSLAAEYGITWQQVGLIVRGDRWNYDMRGRIDRLAIEETT